MRKINKKCNKATKYKAWLDTKKGKHPKYSSSSFRFYRDIKANLMACQEGLCAYTEIKLDDSDYFKQPAVWENGVYIGDTQIQGQLDHFDFLLKKRRKGWEWSNFFLCHSDINNAKLDQPVYDFMKPDGQNYSPYKYLDYNYRLHKFTASPKIRDLNKRAQVEDMIKILGLNYGSIQRLRKKYLNDIFIDFEKDTKGIDELSVDMFFTAFEIIRTKFLAHII